jgi:lysophospholipase L1-like esterase
MATVVGDAVAQSPTFFTLWIGNNDILGYATGGGSGDLPTNSDAVAGTIDDMLQALTANGAKGAIANIPDIMGSPYFTVMSTKIPYNGLVLTEQAQVDGLNAAYAPLGITFQLGQNPFIVQDAVSPYPRQMKETDIFLLRLPTDSIQCFGYGSLTPIPHKYILDAIETANVTSAISVYNQNIQALAGQYGLAYVDSYKMMQDLKAGIVSDGVTLNSEFVTGNAFSLDGIHLTQVGYAYVANQFIMAINEKYGSNLPTVSLASYPGVDLP